jgi:hypothetical protein
MSKPFHLMTPAERTALRIAQNREIAERVAQNQPKVKKPPTTSTGDFTRATPEERAQSRAGVIRKVQS